MQYKNNILPFNEFWVNCDFNSRFSILTSYDEAFRKFAYNNTYKYTIAWRKEADTRLYDMYIESTNDECANCLDYIPVSGIKEKNHMPGVIKKLVLNNEAFLIGVDLYNYIQGSVCWNKFHWYHYSLVKGYDDQKDIFYVLDDNLSGYHEFEIATQKLIMAAKKNQMDYDGYIVLINENKIRQFDKNLDMDMVKQNAKCICENIGSLDNRMLWEMSEDNYSKHWNKDLDTMYLFQIRNRQLANQLLLKSMKETNRQSTEEKYDNVINEFIELEKGWKLVQRDFIKIYHTKEKQSQVEKTNAICRQLLQKEMRIWEYVICYL